MTLELMPGGDLFSNIEAGRGVSAPAGRYVLLGVCSGLQYLHTVARLVHLDLKAENVLHSEKLAPGCTSTRWK